MNPFRTTANPVLLAIALAGTGVAQPAIAVECEPVSSVNELFLAETPDIQASGEHQIGLGAARADDGDRGIEADYEYGVTGRTQVGLEWSEERNNGERQQIYTASIEHLFFCGPGIPLLKLDLGVEHDNDENETGGNALLALGRAMTFGSWILNASHSRLENETAYAAALVLDTRLPFAIEASHARGSHNRATWISAGIYVFSTDRFEVGIAFADGSADASGEWEALLSVVGEF